MQGSVLKIHVFKLTSLLVMLLYCSITNGQAVRVIDNKGTINTVRNNQVTRANTAPLRPLEGDVWYDTSGTTTVTNTYNGTAWVADAANVYTGFFIITTPGTAQVIDVPFQPSQVTFVAHANVEALDLNTDSNGAGNAQNNTRGINNAFGTMNGFARANTDGSITQQVIYIGSHGNSINDISRFSSSSNCIGIRYGNQNGVNLGVIRGAFAGFTANGFEIDVTYVNGSVTVNSTNPVLRVQPDDVQNEDVVVLFTAYR